MTSELHRKLASVALIVGLFLLWEFLCLAFNVSDVILPRPSQVFVTLWQRGPALWPHTMQTLYTTMLGFLGGVLIGIMIGVIIGWSKLAYDVAYPLLVGFSSIPKVAVVPIFVLYFGSGTVPAVLTALIMAIFPVVVNVATGLATTEPELEDVMKALKATKFDILWNVGLPRAMPYFFASLKVAITLVVRRLGDLRDRRVEPRHRQHDDDRQRLIRRAARVRRAVHSRGARRRPLRHLFAGRRTRHRVGASQDRIRHGLRRPQQENDPCSPVSRRSPQA